MWKYSTLVIVLVVLALCIATMYALQAKEGFTDGAVPTASESAAPGATTANPTVSTGQAVDVQATIESIRIFNDMMNSYKTNAAVAVAPQTQTELNRVALAAADFLTKSASEKSAMRLADIQALRADVEAATNTLRGVLGTTDERAATTAVPALPAVQTSAAPSDTGLTLDILKTLRTRIASEVARLEALRTNDATTLARITQLQKLSADVAEYLDRIERGQIQLADVPISAEAAEAFLKVFESADAPLPPLIAPDVSTASVPSVAAAPFFAETDVGAVQQMLDVARDLKWNFHMGIEHDPAVAQRKEILQRLDAIETRLNAVAVSGKSLSADETQRIQQQFSELRSVFASDAAAVAATPRNTEIGRRPVQYTRGSSAAEYPSAGAVAAAQGRGFGPDGTSFPHGELSPDIWIRPGFLMNDATIARRASASAFDPTTVGGADYKQRAADLCRQIKSAQLGDPAQFGCIAQPDTVGTDYSWKGNYQMVCNRLGYTWGAWYPEMFGCPKQDPTQHFKTN